jgi:hypothetical protein
MDVAEQGMAVVYESEAVVREESIGSLSLQWERRTPGAERDALRGPRQRDLLLRDRLVGGIVLGHKLWRSSGGPVTHLVLLLHALWRVRSSRYAQAFLLGHAVLGAGIVAESKGRHLPGPLTALSQALFLQGVALGGVWRVLRKDRVVKWDKPAR